MFKNKRVTLMVECKNGAFASYSDLTSDEGKKHINEAKEYLPYRHYMFCIAARLILISADVTREKQLVMKVRQCTNLQEHKDYVLTFDTKISLGNIVYEITAVDGGTYPSVSVNLLDRESYKFASLFEFMTSLKESPQDSSFVDSLLRLEIRYIGQTEITDKYFRLDTHGTYAREADRLMKSAPHQELFIKLLQFDLESKILVNAQDPTAEEEQEIRALLVPFAKSRKEQWITFLEAAMIGAIKPPLNTHYKNSFPSSTHAYAPYVNKLFDELALVIDEDMRRYSTYYSGAYRRTFACVIQLDNC